jgi:hypothetical protein
MTAPDLPPQGALRLAVGLFRMAETRRQFPPRLQVGTPGGEASSFEDLAADRLDADLRTEVGAALLSRALVATPSPAAWLTRTGELSTHDTDLVWLSATERAAAEAGIALPFVVVTRRGWYDPRTGARREWRRLRL